MWLILVIIVVVIYITYMFDINTDPNEVGVADFPNEIKAITLMRWIKKSIEKDEFVKIK
jgi:uncharacterized membrane protein